MHTVLVALGASLALALSTAATATVMGGLDAGGPLDGASFCSPDLVDACAGGGLPGACGAGGNGGTGGQGGGATVALYVANSKVTMTHGALVGGWGGNGGWGGAGGSGEEGGVGDPGVPYACYNCFGSCNFAFNLDGGVGGQGTSGGTGGSGGGGAGGPSCLVVSISGSMVDTTTASVNQGGFGGAGGSPNGPDGSTQQVCP